MPRQPRELSGSGVYHLMVRGVNHCQLFEESEDFERFLSRLGTVKAELSLSVLAYCLMSNHVHLLVKEQTPGDVVAAMRRILTPYAWWFNRKYGRCGALVDNRYRSECVTDDEYLLTVVRYIHRNPVEAGIVADVGSYRWSSYHGYAAGVPSVADTGFVLSLFSPDPATALDRFEQFHRDDSAGPVVRPFAGVRRDEREIRSDLAARFDGLEPGAVGGLPQPDRNAALAYLRGAGFSTRQIERATGVPRGVIVRCQSALLSGL